MKRIAPVFPRGPFQEVLLDDAFFFCAPFYTPQGRTKVIPDLESFF